MTAYQTFRSGDESVYAPADFSHGAASTGHFQSPVAGELTNVARPIFSLTERPPLELFP
jgi:hypothetical protein